MADITRPAIGKFSLSCKINITEIAGIETKNRVRPVGTTIFDNHRCHCESVLLTKWWNCMLYVCMSRKLQRKLSAVIHVSTVVHNNSDLDVSSDQSSLKLTLSSCKWFLVPCRVVSVRPSVTRRYCIKTAEPGMIGFHDCRVAAGI